ncbi:MULTISPECIES: DUF6064 family protein [Bacteroides]|uniref:DUF6064 family protein n=1 Tax=Bacteroides TaxID=816 RepID=UPI001D39D4BB|nr:MULTISPECIES: DUF6064 family protein [Bacteroides]HJD93249.1 DUF6064 family protein [Bacteroides coprosuis]
MDIFWTTIANYNSETWLYQVIILLIGFILTTLLIKKPSKKMDIAMKLYLAGVFTWISLVYYDHYCAPRGYSNILTFFWILIAGTWVWDAIRGYTTFAKNEKYNTLGYLLMIMPFIYPLLSMARGLTFPAMTSPLLPCSVTTFTIGLLLLRSQKVNMFIVLFLCHWSLIGLTKTYFYNIPEDFLLVAASIPAIYLFFKEYFLQDLHKDTKPNAKYINLLLMAVCLGIGIVLTVTLIGQVVNNQILYY